MRSSAQYIALPLQLLVGVVVFNETLTGGRLVWFFVVWIALALYSFDSYRGHALRNGGLLDTLPSDRLGR